MITEGTDKVIFDPARLEEKNVRVVENIVDKVEEAKTKDWSKEFGADNVLHPTEAQKSIGIISGAYYRVGSLEDAVVFDEVDYGVEVNEDNIIAIHVDLASWLKEAETNPSTKFDANLVYRQIQDEFLRLYDMNLIDTDDYIVFRFVFNNDFYYDHLTAPSESDIRMLRRVHKSFTLEALNEAIKYHYAKDAEKTVPEPDF